VKKEINSDTERKVLVPILVALMFLFLATTIYLIAFQDEFHEDEENDDEEPGPYDNIEFYTDKSEYSPGESVTFILKNNGTIDLIYDSELRDKLRVFDRFGGIVLMEPWIQTLALTPIHPGESRIWTWNQTYYLYVWEEGKLQPTWDHRSWTQVTTDRTYTARIVVGDLDKEWEFGIKS
jgi:hypothetical protein